MSGYECYERLSTPPKDALRTIGFGKLKGKSDINPQWRYEALTREYGMCGVGWKYELVNTQTVKVEPTGEMMLFVQINLYTRYGEDWSDPIIGFGGDFIIIKDKNGIHGNDDAYKMAITDAIGNAAKMIGVASDVYRGKFDTKNTEYETRYQNAQQAPQSSKPKQANTSPQDEKKAVLKALMEHMKKDGMGAEEMKLLIQKKFGKESSAELSLQECKILAANYNKLWAQLMDELGKGDAA